MQELSLDNSRLMVKKGVVRGYIPIPLKQLLRAVVALRMDRDWTMSDVLEEALVDWLNKRENQEIIKEHRLEGLIDDEWENFGVSFKVDAHYIRWTLLTVIKTLHLGIHPPQEEMDKSRKLITARDRVLGVLILLWGTPNKSQ